MLQLVPGEIRIGGGALTLLHRVLDAADPEEGCGLLLGERAAPLGGRGGPCWVLRRTWPCRNVWEPRSERSRRFLVDPREQLHAIRWGRAHGLALLGSLHSHPGSAPCPSPTDRALAPLATLMLIRGGGSSESRELRCWWLDPDADPLQLPWRMEA